MFSRKARRIALDALDDAVWFGRHRDTKREVSQWAHPDVLRVWEEHMREAFNVLGMMDWLTDFYNETAHACPTQAELGSLIPVVGLKNRLLLRKATVNIDQATTTFRKISTPDGIVICHKGSKEQALEQWGAVCELLGQTTMVTLLTPGLRFYVKGTQVGYTPATRHLFKRSNTVERVGLPNEPHWRMNVSGITIDINGDWESIKAVRKNQGYNLFQMVQLQLNAKLEEAIRKG